LTRGAPLADRVALAFLGLLLLAGCARPVRDDLYVLLPDREGRSGVLQVESGGQRAALDQPYAAVRVPEPGRIQAGTVSEAEARQAFGSALDARPPRPTSFIVYFLVDRDELTPESTQTLDRITAEIARRPAPEIVVIGHTDRVGTTSYNDALSLRRAERVRDELLKVGVAPERIRLEGRGEREPLVPTEDEVAEPRNRRVEISVR
jgi:outer membrane protein OmpA-like peptidoglycan-associated protein